MWHWYGGWGLPWMLGWMLLVWGAVIVGLIFLIRYLAAQTAPAPAAGPGGETSRAILDRRLASGEITREEYDELRRRIEG